MKLLYTLFLGLALTCQAKIGVEYQMQLGNPTDAKADTNNHEHFLIQRRVFAIDYDDREGGPNWVSWDLTSEDMGPAKRSLAFYADTGLPAHFQRITSSDYKQSGFNRGHMCPSADRTVTAQDNEQVFTMINIIPQTPDNNQGVWKRLEDDCRKWAREGNELLIICGPAKFNSERLPNGPVLIPTRTWKIVVVVPNGPGSALSRITPQTKVIAVDIPNTHGVRKDPWQRYVVSVNQIEALTGYHFFTALPPELASVLKAKVDGQFQYADWILAAICILAVVLVLVIVVLVVFFKTRPKRES